MLKKKQQEQCWCQLCPMTHWLPMSLVLNHQTFSATNNFNSMLKKKQQEQCWCQLELVSIIRCQTTNKWIVKNQIWGFLKKQPSLVTASKWWRMTHTFTPKWLHTVFDIITNENFITSLLQWINDLVTNIFAVVVQVHSQDDDICRILSHQGGCIQCCTLCCCFFCLNFPCH